MALFESYERRINKINGVLQEYGIADLQEAEKLCKDKGFSPAKIVKDIQPIAFENACGLMRELPSLSKAAKPLPKLPNHWNRSGPSASKALWQRIAR